MTSNETLYEKCAKCHLFIGDNHAYVPGGDIAQYDHFHRGDEADEKIIETHDATPSGQKATLSAWMEYGPVEMKERFIDQNEVTYQTDHPVGWWIHIERQYSADLHVGPYSSEQDAEHALEEAPLIDDFCEKDALGAVLTTDGPGKGDEQFIIVPSNPDHMG